MSTSKEKTEVLAGYSLLRGPEKWLDFRVSVGLSGSHHLPHPTSSRQPAFQLCQKSLRTGAAILAPPPRAFARPGGVPARARTAGGVAKGAGARPEEARGSDATRP